MVDEGFHEIQLGRKQLVFLFMAAAVFSVVVFLIGVWVGRDVRRPQSEIVAEAPAAEVTPDTAQPPTQVPPGELDYTQRLQTAAAKPETKPEANVVVPAKPIEPPTPPVESGPPANPPKPEPKPAAKPEPKVTPKPEPKVALTPGGVTLQVAAFNAKKPADTLMNRLKKKGYAAFVFVAPSGPSRFKVRVGPFADRASADESAVKLKKEEGLTPLVQR